MWILFAGVAALVAGFISLSSWRKKWTIDDTPTSTCRGVFVGRNEVVGTAQPLYEPLIAPFTQQPVVWFSWELEEYKKSGDNSQWVTIERRATAAPFWLQDETGRVLVRPRRAEVESDQSLQEGIDGGSFAPPYSRWQLRQWVLVGEDEVERRQSLADPDFHEPPKDGGGFLSFTADTAGPISALRGKNRVTERVIPVGVSLYLLGTARPRSEGHGLEFAGEAGDLLVSTKSEAQVAQSSGWSARIAGLVCLAASALFAGAISESTTGEVRWSWPIAIVAAELAGLFLITLVRNYNRQVEVKEQAAKAWSLIDVSLQRRAELIPTLVEVVQAYGAHERDVQQLVAELRSVPAPPAPGRELPDDATIDGAEAADRGQRTAARSTAVLAEAYPDLKASEVYLDLQRRYADAEEAVASARTFYNDAIEVLRTRRSQFPGSLFARYVRVPSWKLFEAEEAATYVPAIEVAPTLAPAPNLDPVAPPAPPAGPPPAPPAGPPPSPRGGQAF